MAGCWQPGQGGAGAPVHPSLTGISSLCRCHHTLTVHEPVARHLHAGLSGVGLLRKAWLVSLPLEPDVDRPLQGTTQPRSLLLSAASFLGSSALIRPA